MSIEPSAVRFNFGSPVLPPKPERRAVPRIADLEATLAAMKADARRIEARTKAEWGHDRVQASGPDHHATRKAMAAERNERNAADICDLLTKAGPMTRPEIAQALGITEHQSKMATLLLRDDGRVKAPRAGLVPALWSLA